MMTYQQFAKQVEAAGLTPRECWKNHFQILGGNYLVNYYPETATIYIDGTRGRKASKLTGNVAKAIQCCRTIPQAMSRPSVSATATRKKLSDRRRLQYKTQLWKSGQTCAYCGNRIEHFADARLDHRIPLAQGGSNNLNNLRLACVPCDKKKGAKQPHNFNGSEVKQG